MGFTKKSLGVENKSAEYHQLPTLQLDDLCLLFALAFTSAFFPARSPKIKSFNFHQTSNMEGRSESWHEIPNCLSNLANNLFCKHS